MGRLFFCVSQSSLCPSFIPSNISDAGDISPLTKRTADAMDPVAEKEKAFYQEMLIKLDVDGRRVISNGTARMIMRILQEYDELKGDESSPNLRAIFELNRQQFQAHLEADTKYRAARLRYESLEQKVWLLRYGDYMAWTLGDLRQIAWTLSPTGDTDSAALFSGTDLNNGSNAAAYKTFMSRPWVEIQAQMLSELENEGDLKGHIALGTSSTPMVDLLEQVAKQAPEWSLDRIQRTMRLYVDRSKVDHSSHIRELFERRQFRHAVNIIVQDIWELEDTPLTYRQYVDAVREAILQNGRKYFVPFRWNEDIQDLDGGWQPRDLSATTTTAPPKSAGRTLRTTTAGKREGPGWAASSPRRGSTGSLTEEGRDL